VVLVQMFAGEDGVTRRQFLVRCLPKPVIQGGHHARTSGPQAHHLDPAGHAPLGIPIREEDDRGSLLVE